MIENRSRLERQVLLGRQTVRKLLRSPATSVSKTAPSDEPITGTRLPLLQTQGADIEMPMSMDTDAETAFAKGAEYFFRSRSPRTTSPHPDMPANGSAHDFTRRDVRRRKAVSQLFESPQPSSDRTPRTATPDPLPDVGITPSRPGNVAPPSPSTFFSRLRTQSFQKFATPFTSMRRAAAEAEGKYRETPAVSTWSSDSSSDDDTFGEVHAHAERSGFLEVDDSRIATSPETLTEAAEEGDEPDVDV